MRSLAKKNVTVFAVLVAASLVATPLVMSASSALATGDDVAVAVPVAVVPVEVAPVAAPVIKAEGCTRKVRVVYSGYGMPDAACLVR